MHVDVLVRWARRADALWPLCVTPEHLWQELGRQDGVGSDDMRWMVDVSAAGEGGAPCRLCV